MKKWVFAGIVLLCTIPAFGQYGSPGGLEVLRGKYYQGEQRITRRQAAQALRSVPEAFRQMRRANVNYALASGLFLCSGTFLGIAAGTAFEDPEVAVAGVVVAAGFALLGLPVAAAYQRRSARAVDLYNDRLLTQCPAFRPRPVYLTAAGSGIGIALRF